MSSIIITEHALTDPQSTTEEDEDQWTPEQAHIDFLYEMYEEISKSPQDVVAIQKTLRALLAELASEARRKLNAKF